VHANTIIGSYDPFTSYTSSKNAGESRSSSLGNRRYTVSAYRNMDSDFRNFCFAVTDLRYDEGPPWYDALTTPNDKIRQASYYFSGTAANRKPVAAPFLPDGPVPPDTDGKKLIRLHYGHEAGSGSGSDGCMVSPRIYALRTKIIEIHQAERALLGLAADPHLAKVAQATTHQASKDLWSGAEVPYMRFSDRIMLELICVRPDQRPATPPPP
jgi:hypothetical protein